MFKKKVITGAIGLLGLVLGATIVLAAPGDAVQPPIDPPGLAGAGCSGIGVAFDGTNIWYTCANEDKVRKTDLVGTDNGFITTAEGLTSVSVDAIAWDSDLGVLWGGELVDSDGVGGNDTCRIYTIDPTTGAATTKFDRTDIGCGLLYFDGLTVDNVTNTLYYSPDVQKTIRHLTKAGAAAANDPIDFETLTSSPDLCPAHEPAGSDDPVVDGCPNSGLAIGIDGKLFAGTNGAGRIITLDPVAKTFLSDFATVTGRDEDLECGPVVEGKETILSRDFETGHIDVLEAPEGSCVSPAVPIITLDPKEDTNELGDDHAVTATVTLGGVPIEGTLVNFSITAGPNAGEVSGPGECTVDPDCNTDSNGQTSWTYSGSAGEGTDIIVACFSDEAGEEHCARVLKEWISHARMTGGGTIPPGDANSGNLEGKHGFELHCDPTDLPNRLEVNWGKGNKFHLETLTTAVCSNDPNLDEEQPVAGFDTYKGTGSGRLNGVPGVTAKWEFTDDGEPGVDDHAVITIFDGVISYTFSGNLTNGNHQAHPAE